MAERNRRARDPNEWAKGVLYQLNGKRNPDAKQPEPQKEPQQDELGKNPYAVALGKLGTGKGGKAGVERLSPKRRGEIARKAARGRGVRQNLKKINRVLNLTKGLVIGKLGI